MVSELKTKENMTFTRYMIELSVAKTFMLNRFEVRENFCCSFLLGYPITE